MKEMTLHLKQKKPLHNFRDCLQQVQILSKKLLVTWKLN